jgi:hypothetical protein
MSQNLIWIIKMLKSFDTLKISKIKNGRDRQIFFTILHGVTNVSENKSKLDMLNSFHTLCDP